MGFPPFNPSWLSGAGCTPLTLDGSASATFASGTTGTVDLTTLLTNDVILVVACGQFSAQAGENPTIFNVSSPHLTFNLAGSIMTAGFSPSPSSQGLDLELWWAPAAAVLTGEVITVQFLNAVANGILVAFGLHGSTSLGAPFDTNTFDVVNNGASTNPLEINTSVACEKFVYAGAGIGANAYSGPPTGFAAIFDDLFENAGGVPGDSVTLSVSMSDFSVIYPSRFLSPQAGNTVLGAAMGVGVLDP